MRPRAWLAAALAALCLVAGFGAWRWVAGLGPRRAAEEYVLALARADAAAAQSVSSGEAAYAAARLKDSGARAARAASARAWVLALGRGWVLVEAEAELLLSDGTADAGWYRLQLVRVTGDWKVVDFQAALPRLSGVGLPSFSRRVPEEALGVFREYLSLLAQGKYSEAARLCVGPARAAQEREAAVLGRAPLFREVGEVSAKPLWRKGGFLAFEAEYGAGGRPVKAVVLMRRTGQGWRIAGVSQS